LPGTNQVQSISECSPKISTTVASVSSPIRSGSNGSPRSRRRSPVARAAAQHPRDRREQREPEPDQPEVGQRLDRVAVRVAHDEPVGR
jgi:hypothetical protein